MRPWPNPTSVCYPTAESKKRPEALRGTSLSSVKVRKKSRMLMRKGEACTNGENYHTDENEENLNDLMLKMRRGTMDLLVVQEEKWNHFK